MLNLTRCAPVAINDGNPEEAERLAKLALDELPLAWFYSRIVATSVHGEVLHCKGDLSQSLSLMQQTEQMARHHDVWHYALWSLIQQSEIQFAQWIPAGRMGNAGESLPVDQRATSGTTADA